MKAYYLFIQRLHATICVHARNKQQAIAYARDKEHLTHDDSVVCLGINL